MIICQHYFDEGCNLDLTGTCADCLDCKDRGKCALECDCESETCNIGRVYKCPLGLKECTGTCDFCKEELCDYPYIGAEKVKVGKA